jgi:hypothetical protein
MIILQLTNKEKINFIENYKNDSFECEIIESRKLGGDEIVFQIIITAVSIASPYIVDYFKDSNKKNDYITLIKDGVKIMFEDEKELRKFLKKNSKKKND